MLGPIIERQVAGVSAQNGYLGKKGTEVWAVSPAELESQAVRNWGFRKSRSYCHGSHKLIHLYLYSLSALIKNMKTTTPPSATESPSYQLAELCVLADLPVRTVRYYVQIGLVDRPAGETRAARYGSKQLEQLLLIKKWTAAGVSLERIRELLQGEPPPVAPRRRSIGSVEVRSHLLVADGVELVIEPGRAGLSPEQVRQLIRRVMTAYTQVTQTTTQGDQQP
jgi:DNA-binding transcriptional MerR regulator